jgi:tetratricopeptide (TPR) repeat protein
MEIATALKREIRVIPVLVDGALMPRATELPEDLKLLVRRNALRITDTSFDGDCQRLVAAIKQVLEKAATEEQEREKSRLDAENRDREERQRQEAEKSEAQRQDNERLASERREKDRLEAERLEAERRRGLEAEQRQRDSADDGKPIAPNPAASQDREPRQAGTPLIVQRKSATISKAVMLSASLVIFGVVLIVGLIWFFGSPLYHSAQGAGSVTSTAGDYYNQGLADLKTKDYDKAINEFNEAIIVDPKYAQAYLYRGTIYLIQGHTAEAQADFDKAKLLGYTGSQ